ncbi:hypothetical protein D9V32_00110 [Mycetocola tolaasinivorans]|uniref:Uncharacterized protein n=1 Tax=Mycetocola tolaasinivorans TaxID=76635 RepID=A0A3L7ABA5_9MICO|nr:hypothetical protein [Mycetocola tolaasinivorans]RLP77776.1 hypothetical protein D9V32_00110 [Mycetocola tolaasinivorans]
MLEISAPGYASRATPGETGSGQPGHVPDSRELARFDREVALRAAAIAAFAAVVLAGALLGVDALFPETLAPFPDDASNTIVLIPATVLGAIISVWGARSVERRRGQYTPLVPLTTLALGLAVASPYLVLPVVTTVMAGTPSRRAIASLVFAAVIWVLVGLAYRRAIRLPDTAVRRIMGRTILVVVALLVLALLCTGLAAPWSFYAFLLLTPGYAFAPFLFVGLFAWAGALAGRDRRGDVPGLAFRTRIAGSLILISLVAGTLGWVGIQRVANRDPLGWDLSAVVNTAEPLADMTAVRVLVLIALAAALLALLARRTAGTAVFLVISTLLALIVVPMSFRGESPVPSAAPAAFAPATAAPDASNTPDLYNAVPNAAPTLDPADVMRGSRSSVLTEEESIPRNEVHYESAAVPDGTLIRGISQPDLLARFTALVDDSAHAIDPQANPTPDIQTVACAGGTGVSYAWGSDALSAGADDVEANAYALVRVGQVWNAAGHNLAVARMDNLTGVRSSAGIGQTLSAQHRYDHVTLGMTSICVSAH